MTDHHYEDVTVTNSAGEAFHLSVFAPRHAHADNDPATPPVVLCVHGAGMSGDSFFRLADYIQCEGKGYPPQTPLAAAAVPGWEKTPPPSPPAPSALPPSIRDTSRSPALLPAGGGAGCAGLPPAHPSGHKHTSARPAVAPLGRPAGDCAFMLQPTELPSEEVAIAVVTYDMRCHGMSTYAGGEDSLTVDVLVQDFLTVLQHVKEVLYPRSGIYVLGHSLGGAIVAAGLRTTAAQSRVAGVILVDVVEGTARMSLTYMREFLDKRPESFDSVKDAEAWFLRHGGMRSPAGAAVSVPPLLKQDAATGKFVWRSDLRKMDAVWDHWFDGLNKAFVSLQLPKMLCLANAERLDAELTVAQMQGKFQFEIIGSDCGHYVMDDATAVLGSKVMRFVKRIETLTRKLKAGIKPGMPLHFNNSTIPPSRLGN